MSEYALYKGRPVKKVRSVAGFQEVRLADGNLLVANRFNFTEVSKEEYDRLVKEEAAENERLSERDAIGSCEFLALKKHGTGAAQDRNR